LGSFGAASPREPITQVLAETPFTGDGEASRIGFVRAKIGGFPEAGRFADWVRLPKIPQPPGNGTVHGLGSFARKLAVSRRGGGSRIGFVRAKSRVFPASAKDRELGSFAQNFALSQRVGISNCQRATRSETFPIHKVSERESDFS